MLKLLLTLSLTFALSACATRRAADDVDTKPVVAAPAPDVKPKIRYVYVERKTLPTESAMTIAPLDVPPGRQVNIVSDIVHVLWPLLALLGAGAVLIAGLYAEHKILNRQLAARRSRVS
jgi:hypothetical protein